MASLPLDSSHVLRMQYYSDPADQSEGKVPLGRQENLTLPDGRHDDIQLQRLGKNPVLKRNWGVLSVLGLACTILGTWEGLLATFILSLTNGGSAGAIYGFIFVWIGTACYFVVLAELASMAPTSGGQYHWCAMLAPKQYRNLLSYITGWLSVVGWQAAFASAAFLFGTQLQGAISLAHENYHAKAYQGTLIMWAFLCIAFATNMVGGKFLPRLESGLLCFHIVGFLGIMIPLVVKSQHKAKEQVFKEFHNGGEFPNQGLSWFVGLCGAAYAFGGGDACVHMAEECANAEVAIPKAMILTVGINGCLGFGMLLTMLFCSGNIDDALASRTGYPFMEIFLQGTGSIGGALAMTSVLLFAAGCSIFGMLAATSRQFWSFSRDKGVPGWNLWSKVYSRHLPVPSIILTVIFAAILGLINIGSKVALEDILSMAVAGLYSSYLIVSVLLLYRRCKGDISRYGNGMNMQVNLPGARLAWGPFHVPGIVGVLINGFSVFYMGIIIFFSFWPSEMHPKANSMNYSVAGTCGVVALASIYYAVRAQHVYRGPIMEVEARGG